MTTPMMDKLTKEQLLFGSSAEFGRAFELYPDAINEFCGVAPVKIAGLARSFGIVVNVSSLGPGVSGQIKKDGAQYLIRVNRYEGKRRQRFTIAHEVSHFILHRSLIDRNQHGITDSILYRSGAPERIEFEANRLAADLLMPIGLITSYRQKLGRISQDEFLQRSAEIFDVSEAAMTIRLNALE